MKYGHHTFDSCNEVLSYICKGYHLTQRTHKGNIYIHYLVMIVMSYGQKVFSNDYNNAGRWKQVVYALEQSVFYISGRNSKF